MPERMDSIAACGKDTTGRAWWLLVPLCIGSGCAALIYEIVWYQMLGLVIGGSVVSLGIVLSTFMAGLCLGSLILWRVVSPQRHPLHVLAWLELGIAALGIALLVLIPNLHFVYAGWGGGGLSGLIARAGLAAVCLLPPTMLMGATLPAIARYIEITPRGVSRIGLLYAANIGGAVAGALLAGFYLLRVHDVTIASLAAAALNVAVALACFRLASVLPYAGRSAALAVHDPDRAPLSSAGAPSTGRLSAAWPVLVAITLSGMTALAAQVIWTRNLSLLLGGTVYTFALILAAFLLGLGIGSAAGARLARLVAPRAALASCQLLLCVAIVWAAYVIAGSLPHWPLDVSLPVAATVAFQLDLLRVSWAILPAAVLWGASFPLALAACAPPSRDSGRLVGTVYAANTLGAIIGALAASFLLVAWLGSQLSQQLLVAVSAISGLTLLSARFAGPQAPYRPVGPGALLTLALACVIVATRVPDLPGELIAFGRFMPTRAAESQIIFSAEGIASSVAVSRDRNGRLTYHTAGKAQASTYPQDMRLQRMLGHLATLVPDRAESFLVIGLGAGVTAGAIAIDPAVRRVVIAELEPLAAEVSANWFAPYNFNILQDPKVELRFDDGRHFLATTRETFDGIVSDPLDPWVKGAAALYTREFWQLVQSRLNPGGVVAVFLQLYETTEEAVRSELATFFDVFPNGAVFANTIAGTGYDAVLLARNADTPIDVDRVAARLAGPDYERVRRSLAEVGLRSAADLFGTYAGNAQALAPWLNGAPLNRDRNLRLQYLAGQGLNLNLADRIHATMIEHATGHVPDVFSGSARQLEELERALRAARLPRN
jgi:spermidine synthase